MTVLSTGPGTTRLVPLPQCRWRNARAAGLISFDLALIGIMAAIAVISMAVIGFSQWMTRTWHPWWPVYAAIGGIGSLTLLVRLAVLAN